MIACRVARRGKERVNDAATVERLVRENARLVTYVARQFHSPLGLEELIAEGNVGLVEAARTFNRRRGTKFPTHAGFWIRAYIMRLIQKESGVYRSTEQRKLFWGIKRAYRAIVAAGGRVTDEEIAAQLGIGARVVRSFGQHLTQGEVRLDAPAFDDVGHSGTLGDRMLVQAPTAEQALASKEMGEQLVAALDVLNERERYVIEQRFLMASKRSLKDIGDEFGLSRERIRQIQARALKKMRRAMRRAG